MGGPDFWSNGIHLNLIEASAHPAEESWRNINAIDDLVREIIVDRRASSRSRRCRATPAPAASSSRSPRTASARATASILNPHYKGMGNLYGSEYWTYLLPRRVAPEQARAITQSRLPIGARQAAAMGLDRRAISARRRRRSAPRSRRARSALAADPGFDRLLDAEDARRARRRGRASRWTPTGPRSSSG